MEEPVLNPVAPQVLSWGANDTFQLGYGSGGGRDVPGPVLLPHPAMMTQVAAGYGFGLVLTTAGLVQAWGANTYGQLGDNSTVWSDRAVPVQLSLPQGQTVTAIAAGAAHGMALASNGDVYTWGSNKYGQLGIGDTGVDKKLTPVRVTIPWSQLGLPQNTTVTAIAAGSAHCLALTSTQQVLAWGYNSRGQLGNNDEGLASKFSPVLVQLPDQVRVTAIAGGREHSLALTTIDRVLAWGSNFRGQLGNPAAGSQSVVPVEVQLAPEAAVLAVSAGLYHSLAANGDGSALSWGDNQSGQLGNPAVADHSDVPVQVMLPTGATVTSIAAGGVHSLAVSSTGRVLGWGANQAGQVGDGSAETDRVFPVWVDLPTEVRIRAVSAGSYFSVALATPGPKLAWGLNESGQLGDGSQQDASDPTEVHLPEQVVFSDIDGGNNHSLAATSDGDVLAWGSNEFGQLGIGPFELNNRDEPVAALLPHGVSAQTVRAGAFHSVALTIDAEIYVWGRNNSGQLGVGPDTRNRDAPEQMPLNWLPPQTSIVAIAAYNLHNLALLSNGQVWAWGNNWYGQLGVGDNRDRNTPTQMILPDGVQAAAIGCGAGHSLVITTDGRAVACGWNYAGQLGTGDTNDRDKPDWVKLPEGVTPTMVAGGLLHSLAVTSEGTILAWGSNADGQLGTGDGLDRWTPFPIEGPLPIPSRTPIVDIACGDAHSLAVHSDGMILAWGSDSNGQIGDGQTGGKQPTPIRVNQPINTGAVAVAAGQYHSLAR